MVTEIPELLLYDLQGVKGFDKSSFIAAHQQPPLTSVRLHTLKQTALFGDNEAVPWCASGRYLKERPVFTLDPGFHAGAYYVQEASSMFLDHAIRHLFPQRNGLRILDLCAAPGGKSTLVASLLEPDSLLVANDVIRSRASILEENMVRWGYTNTWVTSNDPRDFARLPGYFDLMVVDAPCSGSGLFRKDKHALDEWSEANVQLCNQRQQRILADAWPALKEEGILVYATCSYSPQEDEQILDWLAATFQATTLQIPIAAEWGIVEVNTPANGHGYRFFPGKVKGEGLFLAIVQKNDMVKEWRHPKYRSVHNAKALDQATHLLADPSLVCIQTDKQVYNALHPAHEADWHLLKNAVYLRKAGLTLGQPAAKEWIPAHDIALSVDKAAEIPSIQVNKEQALKFLKKEELPLPTIEKGWYLVNFENLSLGWIKSVGNRFNNYLPKHWRIRMDITDADWK